LTAAQSITREEAARLLVEIQTWLYEELSDHLDRLRTPLANAVDEMYSAT
jgi:hypothetical protein